jgi:CheY-like chemotaxis protein
MASLSSVNGLRVLVAEDDGMIAEAICNRLTDMGCEVVATADTGAGAVEAALSTRPDVVLMDVRLKGDMDGIRASELINEKVRVPVVYLTGDSDQKTLARGRLLPTVTFSSRSISEISLSPSRSLSIGSRWSVAWRIANSAMRAFSAASRRP